MSRLRLRVAQATTALFLAAASLSSPLEAQTVQFEDLILGASDAEPNDEFGSGIAIDGDRLAAGAARADIGPGTSSNQGVAYVFDFDGTTWNEIQILRASDASVGDEFGADLALQGDTLAVGARLHDLSPGGDEGAVYVFEFDGTTWTETQKLTANGGGPGDQFGQAMRFVDDFLFITSPFRDAPGSVAGDEGSVFVYREVAGSYVPFVQLTASDAEAEELFGSSLEVSGDRVVIGAQHELDGTVAEAGAAYVFEYDGETWTETAKLVPSARHDDQHFGASVSIDGDRIVVGAEENDVAGGTILRAGAVWVFEYDGTTWNETATLEASDAADDDNLGFSVTVLDDFIVSGAIGADISPATNQGAAYVFELVGGSWVEIAKLQTSNGLSSDDTGREVHISGGQVLLNSRADKPLVGPNTGGVFFYDLDLNATAIHADFVGAPTAGPAPLAVDFEDRSQGGATAWTWDFGDGSSSTLQNPSHTYTDKGFFDVSLTVTGALGSDTEVQTALVHVGPPIAFFTWVPLVGVAGMPMFFTDQSAGAVDSWSWNFKDGTTSTDKNPTHTFANKGLYRVALRAAGPGGIGGKSFFIPVIEYDTTPTGGGIGDVDTGTPNAGFFADVTSGSAPLVVQFTDASTGAVGSWSWTFGDGGTSTLQNPSHTYVSNGTYTVSLTVTGTAGSDSATMTDYIVVADAPAADFAGDVLTGAAPLSVNFSDLLTGAVTSWSWTFGDGGTSTLQNPSNTYAAAGTYDVALTVTGPGGADTETKVGYVVVTEAAPAAEFSGDVLTGAAPLSVNFSDLSTGAVTSWSWTFGDGGTSTLQNPSYTYAAAGTYDVALTVTGPGGADTETKVGYVVVTP